MANSLPYAPLLSLNSPNPKRPSASSTNNRCGGPRNESSAATAEVDLWATRAFSSTSINPRSTGAPTAVCPLRMNIIANICRAYPGPAIRWNRSGTRPRWERCRRLRRRRLRRGDLIWRWGRYNTCTYLSIVNLPIAKAPSLPRDLLNFLRFALRVHLY